MVVVYPVREAVAAWVGELVEFSFLVIRRDRLKVLVPDPFPVEARLEEAETGYVKHGSVGFPEKIEAFCNDRRRGADVLIRRYPDCVLEYAGGILVHISESPFRFCVEVS